jgi:hypothetical protein
MAAYLTVDDADGLAATLPAALVSAYAAATEEQKAAALEQATLDVDAGGPYQGRRYAAAQTLEFPRVPYPGSIDPTRQAGGQSCYGDVWDWDSDAQAAVVPRNVKVAVLYQANHLLSGAATQTSDRQQAIADGLASQSVGGMSESYRDPASGGGAAGGGSGSAGQALLSPRARQLLARYGLKSGRLL